MRGSRLAPLVAVAALLGGCNWYYDQLPSPDDLMKLVPWFDHMIQSPAVHPYETGGVPRLTPPGAVPVSGRAEADWGAEWPASTATADRLLNPTDPAATLARGDTLFHTFCAVCHGPAGAGNGTVGPRVGAPSLLTERAVALSDGNIYSIIRYGRGVMFRYGDKITAPEDRWAVVNYVRSLQAAATAASAAGGQ